MSEPSRWYPSKIDLWIAALLGLAPLGAIAGSVAGAFAGQPIALAGPAIVLLVYAGLVFPMCYGIADDALIVRFGLVRQRIPLADITEVRPTRNPLSAPALSIDRLRISHGGGLLRSTMISPADKQAFLADLAARARLRRDGDRLVR
jgi:hypothetical protein